ncbi:MAG: EMC6-like membrane protein [Candidatus Syntropharchaeia archaeon]
MRSVKEKAYWDGVRKTVVSCSLGIVVGIASFAFHTGISELLFLLIAILIQKPIYQSMNIEFSGAKDWFYIGFMTFCCWFITGTLILTPVNFLLFPYISCMHRLPLLFL